jgi:hypothetical protein
VKIREMRCHISRGIQLTIRRTAEIAEIKKNCIRIPSAFLCEPGGEIIGFVLRSNRPMGRQLD